MNINDYSTDTVIEANARVSETLAAATAEDETGAVAAWRDADGVWKYVAQADVEHYRANMGREVRTVYLDE